MKPKKLLKIVGIATLVSMSGTMYGCDTKTSEFSELLKQGHYYEAAQFYSENKEALSEEKTQNILEETINDIYKSYKSESVTSDNSISNLNAVYSIADSKVQAKIKDTIELITSNEIYKAAEEAFNTQKYSTAKPLYAKVVQKDSNFKNAQKKISECDNLIKQSYVSEADKKAKSGDYDSAISYLESHLGEFDDTSDLISKISEYNDGKMDKLLEGVNQDIKIGDYYSALVEINTLSKDYPDSKKLKSVQEEAQKSYLDKILPLIDENTNEKKYGEAYSICKNALEVITDSNELKQRLEKLEPLKPILLNEMKISESEEFDHLEDHKAEYEDVVGNKYEAGNLYRLNLIKEGWTEVKAGYAKTFLNAQYSKLDGIIAVSNDSDIGDFNVKILCDNKEMYSGKFNRTTPPQKISVDLRGRSWIEFMISFDGEVKEDYKKCYALLSQFEFTK